MAFLGSKDYLLLFLDIKNSANIFFYTGLPCHLPTRPVTHPNYEYGARWPLFHVRILSCLSGPKKALNPSLREVQARQR